MALTDSQSPLLGKHSNLLSMDEILYFETIRLGTFNTNDDEFVIRAGLANLDAADLPIGVVQSACQFMGGFLEQDADEGTNGTATLEKWDDVTGSNQTAISAAATIDAGAAAIVPLVPVTDAEEIVAAGFKINLVTAGIDGSPAGRVTLVFKKLLSGNAGEVIMPHAGHIVEVLYGAESETAVGKFNIEIDGTDIWASEKDLDTGIFNAIPDTALDKFNRGSKVRIDISTAGDSVVNGAVAIVVAYRRFAHGS